MVYPVSYVCLVVDRTEQPTLQDLQSTSISGNPSNASRSPLLVNERQHGFWFGYFQDSRNAVPAVLGQHDRVETKLTGGDGSGHQPRSISHSNIGFHFSFIIQPLVHPTHFLLACPGSGVEAGGLADSRGASACGSTDSAPPCSFNSLSGGPCRCVKWVRVRVRGK